MLLLAATAACVGAFTFSSFVTTLSDAGHFHSALVDDLTAYSAIGSHVLDGAVPYVDLAIEHLPASAALIIVVEWITQLLGAEFWMMWVPTMTAAFVWSVLLVDRLNSNRPLGFLYISVSIPMLPLVLFRLEPFVALLAVAALVAYMSGRSTRGSVWTGLGALGKGWPVALAVIPWGDGHRRHAVATVGTVGVPLVAVMLAPEFLSSREFDGIHSETALGSSIILIRQIAGSDLGISHVAGAVYVSGPQWLVLLNTLPGLAIIGFGLAALRRATIDMSALVSLAGFIVLGMMLASPLLSTQFIFWIAQFIAALALSSRKLYVAAAILGLLSVAVFEPAEAWWAVVVVAKNGFLLWLAMSWATRMPTIQTDEATPRPVSTSRKNFPV